SSLRLSFFFFSSYFAPPRDLPSFPTRRSSDLHGDRRDRGIALDRDLHDLRSRRGRAEPSRRLEHGAGDRRGAHEDERLAAVRDQDRKSTRLNSRHLVISYAVFCLKKKKKKQTKTQTIIRHLLLSFVEYRLYSHDTIIAPVHSMRCTPIVQLTCVCYCNIKYINRHT